MNLNNRPIVFVANSSWYLFHYRRGLIKKCGLDNKVITLSPVDQSTNYLSSISTHMIWKISRRKSANPLALLIDTFKMFFLLKAIKPGLVHSHTIKANFVIALCTSLLGIPCVISFTGLGKLQTGYKSYFLYLILKFIHLFGNLDRVGFFKINFNHNRTKYIFQNPRDKEMFEKICKPKKNNLSIILGSGVPDDFIDKKNDLYLKTKNLSLKENNKIKGLIYCGRLLKSKGIEIFINISKLDSSRDYLVYGGVDSSCSDSLSQEDIDKYKSINNLQFKGVTKEPLLDFYKKPYILIVPSIYGEGIPRAIAESLLLEIPVLSSRKALSSTFTENMLYVVDSIDPKNYLKMINSIEKEINTNKFFSKLEKGRNFVLDSLTESKVIKDTMKIYKMILKNNKDIYLNKEYKLKSKNWISN